MTMYKLNLEEVKNRAFELLDQSVGKRILSETFAVIMYLEALTKIISDKKLKNKITRHFFEEMFHTVREWKMKIKEGLC